MCGIAGIIGAGKERREIVRSMVSAIAHRGPDGEGIYDDGIAALGHRRLAVIDLSESAAQPMGNEDRSIQITYNGEVYNFEELRASLVQKGHRFRSRSDTEVLVHLYEEEGDRFVEKLNGMFAFAIWDSRRRRALLARDRFGQKPLFYAMAGESLVFASEIKALLAHPGVPRRVSPRAIDSLLTVNFAPAPGSLYEDIRRLMPGHTLAFEPGKAPVTRLYVPPPPRRDLQITFEDATSEVDRLLTLAVKRQLVADVPVGVFASGGIDSTLILAKLRELGKAELSAFALGFHEASHSELPYAQRAASILGAPLVSMTFDAKALLDPGMLLDMFDEPFADVAALPTYALAKAARPHITVALTGDGGDEIFGGYEHHVVAYWLDRLRVARGARAGAAGLLARLLPVDTTFRGRLRTLRRGLEVLGCEESWQGIQLLRANMAPPARRALYTSSFLEAMKGHDPWSVLLPPAGRYARVEEMFGLAEDRMFSDVFLFKSDMASMAAGLEARSPFLDVPLLDFAARLPLGLLVRGASGKRVLRALVEERVDRGLAARRKMGFSPPVDDWLRADLAPLVRDTVLAPGAFVGQYVRRAEVERLFEEHRQRRANHRRVLWALLLLELWLRREQALVGRARAPGEAGASPEIGASTNRIPNSVR